MTQLKRHLITWKQSPDSKLGQYAYRWVMDYIHKNSEEVKDFLFSEFEALGVEFSEEELAILTTNDLIGLWWDKLNAGN